MKTFSLLTFGIAAFLICGLVSMWPHGHTAPTATTATVATATVYPDAPDPKLTPGVARCSDLATLQSTEHETELGRPGQKVKDAIYREYGLDPRHHQPCEVDHLISIELGGSNDPKNLWAEHYSCTPGHPGAHEKDAIENKLAALVRAGTITLPDAQHMIATDWEGAYVKYIGPLPSK